MKLFFDLVLELCERSICSIHHFDFDYNDCLQCLEVITYRSIIGWWGQVVLFWIFLIQNELLQLKLEHDEHVIASGHSLVVCIPHNWKAHSGACDEQHN